MKQKGLALLCVLMSIMICIILLWGHSNRELASKEAQSSEIERIDLDSIQLVKSGVQVDFSEVLIGTQKEMRKLIISTQEATVSTDLTDRLINKLEFDFMKKTQKVSYTGTGYFVVDLDNLTKANVITDHKNKTIALLIDHAYLEAIEIDPNKILIDDVKESLLARGDIELTLKDYNAIEKELRQKLESEFNTAENGQEADTIALDMVKEVYEPIIKAIDSSYTLFVEFKS